MGYLNKQTVTVDAILTKKGRELLARGRSAFAVTKFAVADDEIDYGLYNPAHPLGTEYYGATIENMPVVEASADETQNLRYKLVSLERGNVNTVPVVDIGLDSIILTFGGASVDIIPTTTSTQVLDSPSFGYTAVLFNSDAATLSSEGGTTAFTSNTLTGTASVVTGTRFILTAKDVDTLTTTQLTITGNQSGATITIPVTVEPA